MRLTKNVGMNCHMSQGYIRLEFPLEVFTTQAIHLSLNLLEHRQTFLPSDNLHCPFRSDLFKILFVA
jgi:hypothetical protein